MPIRNGKHMLGEIIADAQMKAAIQAAFEHLNQQKDLVSRTAEKLTAIASLDAIVSQEEGRSMLIFPIPSKKGAQPAFVRALNDGLNEAMQPYKGERTVHRGMVAYYVGNRVAERLPSTLQVSTGWLSIDVHVTDLRSQVSGLASPRQYKPTVKAGFRFDVDLSPHSAQKYKLIRLHADNRGHFPGYKVPFTINFDGMSIETYVTSAKKGTPIGALAGMYIASGVGELQRQHPELWERGSMTMEVVGPGKLYRVVT